MQAAARTRRWELRRNCALTPRQFVASCAALAAFGIAVGAMFWWLGYPFVIAFAAVDALALGAAVVAHARCACDRDVVTLRDGRLVIEQCRADGVRCTELHAAWARVRDGAGVTLSASGVSVELGRHAAPAECRRVATELRVALADATAYRPPAAIAASAAVRA